MSSQYSISVTHEKNQNHLVSNNSRGIEMNIGLKRVIIHIKLKVHQKSLGKVLINACTFSKGDFKRKNELCVIYYQ